MYIFSVVVVIPPPRMCTKRSAQRTSHERIVTCLPLIVFIILLSFKEQHARYVR